MNNKNPLYIVISLVVGFCIGTGLTCSYAKMTRMKTPEQRAITIQKHEKGLTMKQFNIRLKKVEAKIKQLERSK